MNKQPHAAPTDTDRRELRAALEGLCDATGASAAHSDSFDRLLNKALTALGVKTRHGQSHEALLADLVTVTTTLVQAQAVVPPEPSVDDAQL